MRYITFAILIALGHTACAYGGDDSYVCVSDYSTGFHFSEQSKQWKPQNFHATSKFVIARKNGKLSAADTEFPTLQMPCSEANDVGFIRCSGDLSRSILFNNKSLRFIYSSWIGYVMTPEAIKSGEGGQDPVMTIGKCTSL